MRLAQRLLLGSGLVVTVLVVLIVAMSGARLRAQLEALEVAQLTREARLVATQWTTTTDAEALAGTARVALGHRVTLIRFDGVVIGDSEFRGEARLHLQNHRSRPEVMAAVRDGVGTSLRASPSAGDDELYVAVRAPLGVARVSVATTQLDAIVARARNDVLLSGAIALVVAFALAIAFSRAVSRPVAELSDVARSLAAGDLSRRPALAAPGEVGELAAALHLMSEQLASRLQALEADDAIMVAVIESLHEGVLAVDARRQVVRLNQSARRMLGLREPVPFPADHLPREPMLRRAIGEATGGAAVAPAELTIGERTLALTARPLAGGGAVLALLDLTATRRLESVRRDFVANVSHELKTPLTVIGGFAETLVADDVAPEHRRQFAEAIRGSAQRMQRLVDDLLDLSRIESGGWVPRAEDIDARTVVEEIIAARSLEARARGLTLEAAIDERAGTAHADATALRQVLGNLVDNAVRYTNSGGRVTIFTAPADAGAWVGVRDSGVGIAAEHLPRIFERFYRADTARARDAGGTGLGLSIVRHLVEAHGGRVEAESTPGRGTTVRAFFPAPRG